ncbi:hypothetical protein E3N88_10879 [Mikania micrantha]|uniref:Uncharacterized protein n=1 Tax=Mikania micrantha TaxID=192012 RepID=A0A5N6PCW7_9ASTR|nr:hypothetical protein E3N88_10877 [Mikania micrantha]KAD6119608.1 hypothetical protein E3N88_10879 [Mikania micrantha]
MFSDEDAGVDDCTSGCATHNVSVRSFDCALDACMSPMLSWRSGKARIWGTEGPRFEPHSSHPSEVPAAVDPWANRGSLKDAGIAQIRAVSRGGILPAS